MNKKTKIELAIIVSLAIILAILITITLKEIKVNTLQYTNNISKIPKEQSLMNSTVSYVASKEIYETSVFENVEYESIKADENALLTTGNIEVTITDAKVNKTGDSDGGDNTSFYGINSAIIAKSGSILNLKNIAVTTNATGANGVFSYGGKATTNNESTDGTVINIVDSKITTIKDNSGGIMTTGGGVMNATNLIIETSGISSAAIRSDRGGGIVNVDGGTYITTGKGSPAIYSTANITVKNALLKSFASEGAIIEGKNSISFDNVKLEDTNSELNGQSTTYKNIFIYQSMSGDAMEGEAIFNSQNSDILTNKGDSFYVTNTKAVINLNNNKIINNDSEGSFLRIQKDSWGNQGNNGGDVTLNMTKQEVVGNIVIDSISSLAINMYDNSYFEGKINEANDAKVISLKLDKTSRLKLTSDAYLTGFEDEDLSYSNIDFNGYKLYVNGIPLN